jgi:DNA-binding CsgD family transcriptional regulator
VHFNLCFLNLTSPLAKPVHAQDFPLTAQQHEVLKWIASGLLPYQVADKLAITKKTVDFHLENIYRKLGVCSRSQAISKALQIGLVHSYPEILEMS